jgi:hypothetical protein
MFSRVKTIGVITAIENPIAITNRKIRPVFFDSAFLLEKHAMAPTIPTNITGTEMKSPGKTRSSSSASAKNGSMFT